MKKKIMVFALLVALLIGLPVPVPAAANTTETTADDENITWLYVAYKLPDNIKNMFSNYSYVFYRVPDNAPEHAGEFYLVMREYFFATDILINAQKLIYFNNSGSVVSNCPLYHFDIDSKEWVSVGTVTGAGVINYDMEIIASNLDTAYDLHTRQFLFSGIPTFDDSLNYNFKNYCADVGLYYQASSNESDSVIPYSYNIYWHIVRKTLTGKWLLTTIGNSVMIDNLEDYTLMLSDDLGSLKVWNLYCLDDVNGYILNIRQYVYDTDGWRLLSYNTVDSRETDEYIIDLGAGSGIDSTKVLAYTSANIYSESGLDLLYEASTEYYEVTDFPTVTPEPTPGVSSGDDSGDDDQSSSGGGRPGTGQRPEVSSSGGLTFIVDLFSMIWSKICAVPMVVDGYNISLQQIFVYGALVSIVGGFIIRFIFKR